MNTRSLFVLCSACALGACATPQKPLPVQTVEVGISRANYRDFAGNHRNICQTEPRWLEEELVSVNGLVSSWLERTEGKREDDWPGEKLDLLENGARALPGVLDIHEQNLRALRNCDFGKSRGFPALVRRGLEYIDRARDRIQLAEGLREAIAYRKAIALWRLDQPRRESDAMSLCSKHPRLGKPELYYAYQTEEGELRYYFCDGSKVVTTVGGKPEYRPPIEATAAQLKRVKTSRYLDMAYGMNKGDIDRPPAEPEKNVADAKTDPGS